MLPSVGVDSDSVPKLVDEERKIFYGLSIRKRDY